MYAELKIQIIVRRIVLFRALKMSSQAICDSYTMVCPPILGDNPRVLASGLSPVQAEEPWYNYFMPPSSV